MIAKELHLENYFSHVDTTITFDKDFYIILGKKLGSKESNGAGKSTIVRGISYALHGDTTDEADIDQVKGEDVIHNNESEAIIDFKFEVKDNDYQVIRKIKRGTNPSVYIGKNGEKPKKYGVRAGNGIIQDILKADYTIWKSTSYFQQGDLNAFSRLKPKQAKEVVIKLLLLDIYNKYEKTAKDKAASSSCELLKLTKELESIEELERIQEENKEDPKYTKKDLDKVKEEIKELEFHKKLQAFWDNSKASNISFITDYVNKTKEPLIKKQAEVTALNKRIYKLEDLVGAKECPTCESKLNKEDIDKIVALLKKEKETKQPAIDKIKSSIERAEAIETEIRGYRTNIYDESKYYELNSKLAEITTIIKRAKEEKKANKEFGDKKKELKEQIKEYKVIEEKYKKLKEAFGRNGIQAYIIENIIPEIESTTNNILKLLQTPLRMSIKSQKELKKGGQAETLEIKSLTNHGERPYSSCSGGEKTLIDFSLRIALAIILARRADCNIQTLILDEVFGELDSVNKQIVAKAIQNIAKSFGFKKVIVISHQEELKDICPNKIKVVFDGECSRIEKGELNEAVA